MAFTINRAILHVLTSLGESKFSKTELDIESETAQEFIQKHVRRLMRNAGAKEAHFTAESKMYSLIQEYRKEAIFFQEFSEQVGRRLLDSMVENKNIPPSDLLIADISNNGKQYLAILKLNYIECFTRKTTDSNGNVDNQLVKNINILPFTNGRVEEACLIPFDPMILRVLEVAYDSDGDETNYFSQLFLECEAERSQKETAEIIHQITEEINLKRFDNNIEMAAKIKHALIVEAEESVDDASFHLENVAKRIFVNHEEAKSEFLELAQEAGLPYDIQLDKPFVRQQFRTQKFQADNGIEVKFPSELVQDPDAIEFIQNSDGSVSILLKNLRRK